MRNSGKQTDEIDRLQRRIDDLERQSRGADDERWERHRRAAERRDVERRDAEREANDWSEAFSKQLVLLRREKKLYAAELHTPDDEASLCDEIKAVEFAAKIYVRGWTCIEAEFRARQKALLASIAASVEARYPEALDLVRSLRTGNPADLLDW